MNSSIAINDSASEALCSIDTLPIVRSKHPLDINISSTNIRKMRALFCREFNTMSILHGQLAPDISPFSHLMSHGSPIDNLIIYNYLLQLQHEKKKTSFLDIYFFPDLPDSGWESMFTTYFRCKDHTNKGFSPQIKPSCDGNNILIPIHIDESHWVAVSRQSFNDKIIFLYADDLNSSITEKHVKQHLCHQNTSSEYFPLHANWINCRSITYHPHSVDPGCY